MKDEDIQKLAEKHFPPEPWPMRGENYEPTDLNRAGRILAENCIREAISLTREECTQNLSTQP